MIRKITSKQDEEKRRKKNQIIVGLVLVFLMLFSVIGYSFGGDSGTSATVPIEKYNGYEFVYDGSLWNLNIGGTVFSFINNPKNSYKVDSELKSLTSYYGKPLYLYSESSGAGAESEIYRNLYLVSKNITDACPEGESCDVGIPFKTCADNFIIIREKSEAKVFQQDTCVFIEGPAKYLTKIADGFLLKIMGIQ